MVRTRLILTACGLLGAAPVWAADEEPALVTRPAATLEVPSPAFLPLPAPAGTLTLSPPRDPALPFWTRKPTVRKGVVRKPTPKPAFTEHAVLYGRSVRGRALIADVLDNGPRAASDATLIFGGFHGNERSTPAVVESLRVYLKAHPEQWEDRRVVLVPVANPDGWNAGTRVNARGVDLNRNFPAVWEGQGRAARYAPGQAPASEPETQAIIGLLQRLNLAKVVSLHSPLNCLNWTGPGGLALAQAMHRYDHTPVRVYIGYPTPGSLGNYCGARGIGIVTLELTGEGAAAAWAHQRDALLAAIRLPGATVRAPGPPTASRPGSAGSARPAERPARPRPG